MRVIAALDNWQVLHHQPFSSGSPHSMHTPSVLAGVVSGRGRRWLWDMAFSLNGRQTPRLLEIERGALPQFVQQINTAVLEYTGALPAINVATSSKT
jgi:hypothetical protein